MNWRTDGLLFILFYCLLVLIHGYAYGLNDQMDFMPYALSLRDPSLYQGDFYIDCLSSRINERWFIAHVISLFPSGRWPLIFLFIHFLGTFYLLKGLYIWSFTLVQHSIGSWAVLLLTLILFYSINLGGNELYYNMVTPSLLAKSLGIWAMWHAYHSKLSLSLMCTIIAFYIHPIAGFQVFILSCCLIDRSRLLTFVAFALSAMAPYMYSLMVDLRGTLSDLDFVQIMSLRNAHHFFPAAFGLKNYILLAPLFLFTSWYYYHTNKKIFKLSVMIWIGCIVYVLLMSMHPKYAILTQWFKSTIWLEFFGLIAVVQSILKITKQKFGRTVLLSCIVGLSALKGYRSYPVNVYTFPWRLSASQDIVFAEKVKKTTEVDDLFLVPINFTAFKFYAQRPQYVDWKAIPHNNECLSIWQHRISTGYGLKMNTSNALQDKYLAADQYLIHMSDSIKNVLRSAGVDYIVIPGVYHQYTLLKLQSTE